MNERVMQFRVGVVVLFTTLVGGLLVALNSPAPKALGVLGRGTYKITIQLDRAPGIGPDTPVRKNGLLVGRVASVVDEDDHIDVEVNVDKGRRLYRAEPYSCEARTSVLGDATIDFDFAPLPNMPPLEPGAVVKGRVVGNPLEAITELQGDLQRMIQSFQQTSDEVATLAKRVNRAFDDETQKGRVSRLLDKTEDTMTRFSQAADRVDAFFGDPHLQELGREARVTLQKVRTAADDVRSAASSAANNLENLEKLTEPLGRHGERIASSLIKSLDGFGRIVEELTVLAGGLNNREGTIGRLIHDPQVYENLNRLLVNANHVVLRINDVAARLRPVVEDARIFTDKIAREPGRLIGGALNKGPAIK